MLYANKSFYLTCTFSLISPPFFLVFLQNFLCKHFSSLSLDSLLVWLSLSKSRILSVLRARYEKQQLLIILLSFWLQSSVQKISRFLHITTMVNMDFLFRLLVLVLGGKIFSVGYSFSVLLSFGYFVDILVIWFSSMALIILERWISSYL